MKVFDSKEEIGAKIRNIRGKLTQEEFGRRVGIHKNQISRYERGVTTPRSDLLEKIEQYGVREVDFLIISEPNPKYGFSNGNQDRRLPQNNPKRKVVDHVIKILESGNKTVIRALEANIEAFSLVIKTEASETKGGD